MPLQNRVDPFGEIHATPERGLFTGNRGVIHSPTSKTLLKRRWTTKAWIICSLQHPRGLLREPMGRNGKNSRAGWTELFFLDEITALAAGHRPCFYCRRDDAIAFACAFSSEFDEVATAPQMDAMLHRQRMIPEAAHLKLDATSIAALPDGAMICADGQPYALRSGRALPWSFSGYGAPVALPETASLITPIATIGALCSGYLPRWIA
ncbi:hypothetical protein IOD40_10615 [Aquamicrobium sp. cd-1]|uniref:Uncharacterized protein n=1 Tax=Aquamicrobium zhengzhouense TaxID=2781738 RepID=A0ABS0SFA2_9HYPH|nr:hypothetical protein [Aquamicrobium zhengzhouense]